jgi:hypothetical protein
MNQVEQASQCAELVQEEAVFSIEEMESRLEMQMIEVPCDAIGSDGSCCCLLLPF